MLMTLTVMSLLRLIRAEKTPAPNKVYSSAWEEERLNNVRVVQYLKGSLQKGISSTSLEPRKIQITIYPQL